MGGKGAVNMFRQLQADILVPVQYESWHTFTQFGTDPRKVFEEEGISDKICWLEPGQNKRVIL
ncbi:hypothetical protein FDECE_3439, partial [Fusarium decemcellulare]